MESSEVSYVMSPFVSLSRQKAVAVHLVEPLRAPNLRSTTQQPRSQNNSDVAGFVVFITPLWWQRFKWRKEKTDKNTWKEVFYTCENKTPEQDSLQEQQSDKPRKKLPLFFVFVFSKLHSSKTRPRDGMYNNIHIYREGLFFCLVRINALYVHACMYPAPPLTGLSLNPDSQTSVYTIGAWGCWQQKRGEGLRVAVRPATDRDSLRRDPQSARRNSRMRGKAKVNWLFGTASRLGMEALSFSSFSVTFYTLKVWVKDGGPVDPKVWLIGSRSR